VLCCPADESRNRRPTAAEIRNWAEFLRRTINALHPQVVATLGAVALAAVRLAFAPDRPPWRLSDVAARPIWLPPFTLVPLYHPSPRVMNTRRCFAQQAGDLRAVLRARDDIRITARK
jgi:uracil-DNA glycosylase